MKKNPTFAQLISRQFSFKLNKLGVNNAYDIHPYF